jgi:hypothetical protein
MNEIFAELAKGAASELGKAAVRLIFSSSKRDSVAPTAARGAAVSPAATEEELDALLAEVEEEQSLTSEAESVAHGFFEALRTADRRSALSWCDPDWRNDPDRSHALREVLDAAPPVSWDLRDMYGPEDWDGRSPLPWVQFEAVVTYETGAGTYEVIPTRFWVADTRFGWRVWNIAWWPDREQEPAVAHDEVEFSQVFAELFESQISEVHQVIPCTRCPQKLSIPVGTGRLRVRCPECWTVQFVDS